MQFDGIFWPPLTGMQDGQYKLTRTQEALKVLNNPHQKLKNVIHIAGTNGKGSVSAFLESVILKNNHSCGVYTSPHLKNLNERIKLNGNQIEDAPLLQNTKEVYYKLKEHGLENTLTFFEAITVIAFYTFAKADVEFNIIEVGLGGRWDATNVLSSPLLSIITSISLDHQAYLGNTIEKIAIEKCEIIKPKSSAILGTNPNSVAEIFIKKCQSVNTSHFVIQKLETFNNYFDSSYQAQNATLALRATQIVEEKTNIKFQNAKEIIASTKWKGRLEIIFIPQIQKEATIDCAHNIGGITSFLEFISKPKGQKALIFGMLKRKDRAHIVALLQKNLENSTLQKIICVNFEGEECVPSKTLKSEISHPNCTHAQNFEQAFTQAQNFKIFACGSIYMISHLLESITNFEKTQRQNP